MREHLLPSMVSRAVKAVRLMLFSLLLAGLMLSALPAHAQQAAPDDGPGGPILVLTSTANPFSRYTNEVLRAEGLNLFLSIDVSQVSAAPLANYDVAILGEMALTPAQVTLLSDWVNGGGNLIAMRPDKQLAGLLGLTDAAATVSEGYLLVDTATQPGTGIVGETMQYHGTADLYSLSGATAVATLYSDATTPVAGNAPAVTLRSVGANGGQAAAFTYDLARSVVYTRQGNPAWESQERDGNPPIRSNDLFFGNAAGDPQPDWVNLDKVAIPQADEQQRLLANLIQLMNADRKPLPRFWYFPDDHKAVVVMTGDDHGIGLTADHFDAFAAASPANCSLDGLGVHPRDLLHLPRASADRCRGCGLRSSRLRDRVACGYRLYRIHAQFVGCQLQLTAGELCGLVSESGRAGFAADALYRLVRLGDPGGGREQLRHSFGHDLLLLSGFVGQRS